MADVTSTFGSASSTESSNSPAGSVSVGAGLDENLRMIQALMAAWRDQTAWGILNLTSVSGTNTITATLASAGSVTFGPTSYLTGAKFYFVPANTNTGATTLNITSPAGGSALGAKNIFFNGGACTGGELISGVPSVVAYDGTQFNLLTTAPRRPSVQVVTSTGTHSVPAWARRAKVYAKASGGSGGGSSSATAIGGGGGEGEERWGWVNVTPGTTVTVTINAGGTGISANTNSTGNQGGTSVWTDGTTTITAQGGAGGISGNADGQGGQGGNSGSGGDYAMPGASGQSGATVGALSSIKAYGGGKGGGGFTAAGIANSGGGGGGGTTGSASGAGGTGISVTEYWP